MNIRQLRYFLAVAHHGHFTRAAETCFVSQPALSQQIRALEKDLGTPLFDRLPTGAQLTSAGRVLRRHAERMVLELENARAAVEEAAGTVRGELSVAAVHTANLDVVVESLAVFREAHPDVLVRVQEESSDQVVASVLESRVDIGVCYEPAPDAALSVEPLYDEELVLVVPADDPLAGRDIALSEVVGLPLIAPPRGFCLRAGIENALARASRTPRIVAEISALESICEAVRRGLGVTLLPAAYARRQPGMAGLAAVRLDPTPRRTIAAVRHADRHLCLASRTFLRTLAGVVADRGERMHRAAAAMVA